MDPTINPPMPWNSWTAPNADAPPPMNRMGAWLTYRGLASAAYMPNRHQRAVLHRARLFKQVVGDPASQGMWVLPPNETQEYQAVLPGESALVALLGYSQNAAGALVELAWAPAPGDPPFPLTDGPVRIQAIAGTAKKPFWYRRIQVFPAGAVLMARVSNLASVNNFGQIVAVVYEVVPTDVPDQQRARFLMGMPGGEMEQAA